MNSLHDASILNNLGVALLESKDTIHAIHSFQRAVNITKALTDVVASQDVSDASANDSTTGMQYETLCPEIEELCQLQTGTKLESLNQEIYYIYDRPLLLPTNVMLTSQEAVDAYMLTSSAILIFNFGMAYHQFGKETGQDGALRQAVQIYELTLRMINRSYISEYLGKVLVCLALNNLANLHSELCDYENCESCLECVKEIICQDSDFDLFAMDFLDESEWFELKMNFMYGQTPSAACAA